MATSSSVKSHISNQIVPQMNLYENLIKSHYYVDFKANKNRFITHPKEAYMQTMKYIESHGLPSSLNVAT